jgi:hypothetical protein
MSVASHRASAFRPDLASRLPLVRNRSRVIAGIGLVAISTLLIATLFLRAGHRDQVLALSHDITAGQVIQHADLKSVGVASDRDLKLIETSDARSVIGKVATSNLAAGTLLSVSTVSATSALKPGQATVGAALKAGQFPTSLHVGDKVLAVATPSTGTSMQAEPVPATVSDIGRIDEATGNTAMSLTLDQSDAPAIATAGASGNLSLVVLAP